MFAQPHTKKPHNLNRKQRRAAKKIKPFRVAVSHARPAAQNGQSALLNRALKLQREGDFQAAKNIYQPLLSSQPEDLKLCLCLAEFYDLQQNLDDAYGQYKKAVSLQPQNAACWNGLSAVLRKRTDYKAAIIACKQAISLAPDNTGLLVNLATLLELTYQPEDALKILEAAALRAPDNFEVQQALGNSRQFLGRFEEAQKSYRRALKLKPDNLLTRHLLFQARGVEPIDFDRELARIGKVLELADVPDEQRSSGLFASADILDRQQKYASAFEFYSRANGVVRNTHRFDREAHTGLIDQLIDAFPADIFACMKEAGNASRLPVLVVGMPRSGTTLVEQILASHSQAFGASEMPQFEKIDYDLRVGGDRGELKYPRDIKAMNSQALSQIGEKHIAFLRENCSSRARRIIDKMPSNFLRLGLISILFPNAKIIHCRRDPMATCWSCFTKDFATKAQISFAFDLCDLGFYYQEYQRLMEHWHKVLPGRILDVPYEDLIANPQELSRAMISHIELDWEEACLKFNEQNHAVHSVSKWQVRQPIYKSAIDKWRRYEDHLSPLRNALQSNHERP